MDAFLILKEALDVTLGYIAEIMVGLKHHQESIEIDMERLVGVIW